MSEVTTSIDTKSGIHKYTSTACMHGLHDRCRQECKFCNATCRCTCHKEPLVSRNKCTPMCRGFYHHPTCTNKGYKL
jgi:hypothetical protein